MTTLHQPLDRGHKKKQKLVALKNFVTISATTSQYHLTEYLLDNGFSSADQAFQAAIIVSVELSSFRDMVKDKKWRNAMFEEIEAHVFNHMYSVVTIPLVKKEIGSHWVYKLKYKADGTLEFQKARLVAMDKRQVEGEDYGEIFSLVAKMNNVKMFLRVAAACGFEVHQMNVHNVFRSRDLEEEVYMNFYQDLQAQN